MHETHGPQELQNAFLQPLAPEDKVMLRRFGQTNTASGRRIQRDNFRQLSRYNSSHIATPETSWQVTPHGWQRTQRPQRQPSRGGSQAYTATSPCTVASTVATGGDSRIGPSTPTALETPPVRPAAPSAAAASPMALPAPAVLPSPQPDRARKAREAGSAVRAQVSTTATQLMDWVQLQLDPSANASNRVAREMHLSSRIMH